VSYNLGGNTSADWNGVYGNAKNQGMHPFTGDAIVCDSDSGIILVCKKQGNDSLRLRWEACLRQPIESFYVYRYNNFHQEVIEDSTLVPVQGPIDHYQEYITPLQNPLGKDNYYIKAKYRDTPLPNDGSLYWGIYSLDE
jgi:hypothetical protein